MNILTVIAARKGSKGVRDKNIRILGDKPLIVHTIDQVLAWGGYEKFIVSTDSEDIAGIASKYGAEVPFMRPSELATDDCGKIDVLRHALLESEKVYNAEFDALLDLDVTSPLRTVEDISRIVEIFRLERPDCVFSVVEARKNPYFNMVELREDGTAVLSKQLSRETLRRQDSPEVYEMNASMYIYDRGFILDANNRMPYSKKALVYKMDEISRVDIDSELDFKYIEFLIKEGLVRL
jgi:CMP-N,N'-diacetyllegionaminic acid synthase